MSIVKLDSLADGYDNPYNLFVVIVLLISVSLFALLFDIILNYK